MSCLLREVCNRAIPIAGIELLQRRIYSDRRVAGERKAMQGEQHLLAARQRRRLALRIARKVEGGENLAAGLA
jgi:hypothetical protein